MGGQSHHGRVDEEVKCKSQRADWLCGLGKLITFPEPQFPHPQSKGKTILSPP